MRKIVAIIVAVLSLGVLDGLTAVTAQAQGLERQICISSDPGVDQCLNNWHGEQAAGNPINYYSSGAVYGNFSLMLEGRVSSSQPWPFTNGSGMNDSYRGDLVYAIAYQGVSAEPTSWCADARSYHPPASNGQLRLQECNGSAAQLYVLTVYQTLVSVGATNADYSYGVAGIPAWLGCINGNECGDGEPVIATNIQSEQRPYKFEGPA
jgi:hypothetical protein